MIEKLYIEAQNLLHEKYLRWDVKHELEKTLKNRNNSNKRGYPYERFAGEVYRKGLLNNEKSKPIYKKNYHISISHTGNFAVAVVLKFKNINNINKSKVVANFPSSELIPKKDNTKYLNIFLTLLIILNIILLVLILK